MKSKAATKSNSLSWNDWIAHNDASFHNFSPQEARDIREALLTWYRQHRRKLPWRGDPSPWDGSTVDFAQRSAKQTMTGNRPVVKQRKMNHFFGKKKETSHSAVAAADQPLDPVVVFPFTAYGVWVSEIMLQQTRVEAVIPYWAKWMTTFPTVQDLAAASDEQVNAHWAGLGFYRRARLLHQAAKVVTNEMDGQLPTTVEGLLKLDGIGRYTASAIASIAYNITVPVVDGNVCRVLSRLRAIAQNVKDKALKDEWGWTLATQIVEAGDGSCAGEVNQALMELGATYCAPSGTGVEDGDPLKEFYWSTQLGREFVNAYCKKTKLLPVAFSGHDDDSDATTNRCPICAADGIQQVMDALMDSVDADGTKNLKTDGSIGHSVFPLPPPKTFKIEQVYAVAVLTRRVHDTGETAVLMVRRPSKGLLAGQWEFPSALLWSSDNAACSKKREKRKDMSNHIPEFTKIARKRALDSFLKDLTRSKCLANLPDVKRINMGESPLEHVFSHVRHTLWIEHGSVSAADDVNEGTKSLESVDAIQDREVRWMLESDMENVGVTSCVRKILKSVKQKVTNNTKQASSGSQKRKKER